MKMKSIFSCIVMVLITQTFTMSLIAETLFFELEKKKHRLAKVPVELILVG